MRLKDYLKEKNIKLVEFAKTLNITYYHAYLIANHKRQPSLEVAKRIIDNCEGKVEVGDFILPPSKCSTCGHRLKAKKE